ncbi:hypothetical protein ACIRSU_33300 [Streptomyces sp. NPDC101160]|uniref:hypothetical protein n=1 Tax=Streptomyces sp. NPDC101160 TaxID=3366118 RepID=UPI003821CB86
MVRTRLKLAATLTVVVLALTGFQTGSHGGHGSGGKSSSGKSSSRSGKSSGSGKSKSSGGGGGGCTSSKKKNNDYDDYDDDYDNSGGSGGSTATPSPSLSPSAEAFADVVDCVKPAQPKRKGKPARRADTTATVKITSEEFDTKTFRVVVAFVDASYKEVDRADAVVTVGSRGTKTFELAMTNPKAVGRVKRCYVDEVREVPQGTPAPTPSAS